MSCTYLEWVPCRESLPAQKGRYQTIVRTILGNEKIEQAQTYTPQAYPAINGWEYGRTTHWRRHD